jgi:hypothetical protein
MLLRNRAITIDNAPVVAAKGYEHLPASAIAVIRWLNANGVDYVLVGAIARAVRGDMSAEGPVAIVPAPYGRNLDRLARALTAVKAQQRSHAEMLGINGMSAQGDPLKLSSEQLLNSTGWTLICGKHMIDVEGRPTKSPSYQDLLYEAVRIELAESVSAEVASPEDIEHYAHVRRTGQAPEIIVSRAAA